MDAIARYLAAYPAHHESVETWPVQGKLRVRLSLATTLPPVSMSSSVLAMVFNADRQVLYLYPEDRTGSIAQLLIGGRPQAGESPEETVIREVAEETGWRVSPIRQIGFRHFFHLEPHSPQSDRPYPDFIQPIYAARAEVFSPEFIVAGDRIPAEFVDYEVAAKWIEPTQVPLLHAALVAVGGTP